MAGFTTGSRGKVSLQPSAIREDDDNNNNTPYRRGSIRPLPDRSSWRSAYLVKHRDNFSFIPPTADYRDGHGLLPLKY
jgi:hypothetical protein